jgi:hypothetical protein
MHEPGTCVVHVDLESLIESDGRQVRFSCHHGWDVWTVLEPWPEYEPSTGPLCIECGVPLGVGRMITARFCSACLRRRTAERVRRYRERQRA